MDVAELFAEVRDSLADVFASIEWAEDEIAAAQRRWPARADALFHSFSLIRPPVELSERLSVEPVYRAYARELLDRVGQEQDTRPGTAVEVCLGLREASLRAPLSHDGFGLYARMWDAAGLPEVDGVTDMRTHYEAISADALDEAETYARRHTSRADRVLEVTGCCGQHHGEPVTCVYASTGPASTDDTDGEAAA